MPNTNNNNNTTNNNNNVSNEKAKPFDGQEFLKHLRASGVGFGEHNDDTIGASNATKGAQKSTTRSLSDLFDAPPPSYLSSTPVGSSKYPVPLSPSLRHNPAFMMPGMPKPPTMKEHGRNVSWGYNQVQNANQKILKEDTLQQQADVLNGSWPGDATETITMEDFLQHAPFEGDTETAMIHSIDDQEHRSRNGNDSITSTIFTQVPEDGVSHQFEISDMPTSVNHPNDEDTISTGDRSRSSTRPTRQESRSLIASTRGRNNKAAGHYRVMSVEQTLVRLTDAMAIMHGHHDSSSNKQQRHIRHPNGGSSAGDDFARNALLLSGNQDKRQLTNSPRSVDSGKSLWSAVRDNLPRLKKANRQESGLGTSSTSDDVEEGLDDVEEEIKPCQNSRRERSSDKGKASDMGSVDLETGLTPPTHHQQANDSDGHMCTIIGEDVSGAESNIETNHNAGGERKHFNKKKRQSAVDTFKKDWDVWSEFLQPRKDRLFGYIKCILLYMILPCVCVAAIIYYMGGNLPTGTVEPGNNADRPSASYILLFCARQVVTFSLAIAMQGFVVDFLSLGTRVMLRLVGPVVTLLIVQSKGWPHTLFWWGIFDFAMLSGEGQFAHHWIFFQDYVGLFNERNPSGNLVSNFWYIRCLIIAVSISVVVAVKRFVVGLYLGRQTFLNFGQPLATVMKKMLLVTEVAGLAKDIQDEPSEAICWARESLRGIAFSNDEDDDQNTQGSRKCSTSIGSDTKSDGRIDQVIDTNKRHPLTGSLEFSEKMKLMSLLDQWEEPDRRDARHINEMATISAVLRFRKALTFIRKRFPFSKAFGPADNREACIESSQEVYGRLLMRSSGEVLHFETIALLALDEHGNLDQTKAKSLVKIFRPDRQGRLRVLDFVKSVDAVYKEFRLLAATIENSSQIDQAFERIFNVVFYVIVITVTLSQLGFDPLALFLSLSSVIIAFAFMIGSASSKYFDGVLFILGRRPYGIGDRINIAHVETNGSLDGSMPWVVEHVTLFETVLTFLPTNERASLSNGSLANCRIINWARSPQAQFHIFLQFPLDTPFHKLEKFKVAIEEYMKARPREWRALNGFRVNKVFARDNYIEHIIVIQHRDSWQQVGQVLDSKANLTSYCQDVAEKLDMHYQAPRLPVDLKYMKADPEPSESISGLHMDAEYLVKEFQSLARSKHNIRVC